MIVVASAVSLTVPDVTASSRFFTGALGFREELVLDGFVQLRRDDGAMGIELCIGVGTATNAIISFTITDLLAEYERLRLAVPELGPVLRHEPWGERSVRLTDPNGIAVRLVEWVPPAGSGTDRRPRPAESAAGRPPTREMGTHRDTTLTTLP